MSTDQVTDTGRVWVREEAPTWDADRERVFGSVPDGALGEDVHVSGEPLAGEWWRVEAREEVVGYGRLDDVWGDAEILLVVDSTARGTGAGAFTLARLEDEAAARGLNYVLNVVRDTHPDREATTAWFLDHGFTPSEDGRLRKRVGGGQSQRQGQDVGQRQDGRPGARPAPLPDAGRQGRYEAERDRAVAHRAADSDVADRPDRGPGVEESGGYVDVEQHRY